jgi:hypothetical protein
MKMSFVLMSIFMLMLPSSQLEAKEVYLALVYEDTAKGAPSLDALDRIIKANDRNMDYYFANGDLTLQPNQQFIIRGGRGSIKRELDHYKTRNVILNTGEPRDVILSGTGSYRLALAAYGCHVKRPLGRENTTYVILRTSSLWEREKWGGEECKELRIYNNSRAVLAFIDLNRLGVAIKGMPD